MMRLIRSIEGWALALYARILHWTARLTVDGAEHVQEVLQAGRPAVLAAWHGQGHLLLPYLMGAIDLSRVSVIVTDDERTQVLTAMVWMIGGRPYPISAEDNTAAGPRRMLGLIRDLRRGRIGYVHPDGPDGPGRVPKEGVVFLAALAGAWILPFGAYTTSGYRLKRWDEYSLPLPFCRIALVIRPPFQVPKGRDRTKGLELVTRELTLAIDQAKALYRGEPLLDD
ncbi:MAG TPA: hypothetical protein VJK02_24795 [Anaerolineales bacterium]|nr:hypothetical protein [Anaerolineales bacterium]